MKDIDRTGLLKEIELASLEKNFNLYKFIAGK
jgi:hypothetical protein